MICAEDDLHAFHKARKIGDAESEDAPVMPVKWKFIDVSELHLLTELTDGAEIYSKIREEESAEKYICNITHRANSLLQNSLNNFAALN